jgi:hypothetical protein
VSDVEPVDIPSAEPGTSPLKDDLARIRLRLAAMAAERQASLSALADSRRAGDRKRRERSAEQRPPEER